MSREKRTKNNTIVIYRITKINDKSSFRSFNVQELYYYTSTNFTILSALRKRLKQTISILNLNFSLVFCLCLFLMFVNL